MSTETRYTSRTLDQEPDTVAIIPNHPSFIIVGTYSLIEAIDDNTTSRRKGSLQILPFSIESGVSSNEIISLPRLDFPFGIYDIQLHPQYKDILGVATSDAQILFYSIRHQSESPQGVCELSFFKLGEISIEDGDEQKNTLAIVTQLRFIDTLRQLPYDTDAFSKEGHTLALLLAATTQFGNTKLIKADLTIPGTKGYDTGIEQNEEGTTPLKHVKCQIVNVHRQAFDLEAWTTLPILSTTHSKTSQSLLLLSGGDDAQLLVSHVFLPSLALSEIDIDIVDVESLITLKREHEAGIVDICEIGQSICRSSPQSNRDNNGTHKRLILTGSYDETLRLFLLTVDHDDEDPMNSPPHYSLKLISELKLGGGVWRIKELDTYTTSTPHSNPEKQSHCILLIAGHTSGAHIVRLTSTIMKSPGTESRYDFAIEKSFTHGHESLVYAVEARKLGSSVESQTRESGRGLRWEIISASFYDKRVCNWEWTDTMATHRG